MDRNTDISKHITPEQMQKYVQGILSSKESNQVERHLLDCEFCREAMEGVEEFTGKGGFLTDVELLKHRIGQESPERRRSGMSSRMIGIAASVLIILSIGTYFIVDRHSSNRNLNVVEVEEPVMQEKTQEIRDERTHPSIKFPSGQIGLTDTAENISEKENDESVYEIVGTENDDRLSGGREPIEEQLDELEVIELKSEEKEELSFAIVPGTIAPPDTTTELPAEPIIIESEKKVELADIEVDAAKAQSSEVRIRGARSNSKSEVSASQGPPRSSATPEGGTEKFQKYLRRNLKYPNDAKENGIEGKVKISFKVEENGTLSEFKIQKSLGFGCDEEAIRLIKEGPKWNPALDEGIPSEEIVELNIEFKK